ncbi:MAG: Pyruvate-formate lyase-activating enzyme [Candidatus Alkanophagales archaeon MCA70_species_2]|nr:Pyruvate-formate lyase-activating enzyme [Candidatus Alkanophaga liquidiphilum]
MKCLICGRGEAARILGVCASCVRERPEEALEHARRGHERARAAYALPAEPPRSAVANSRRCKLCANECVIAPGERGFCGVRENADGKLRTIFPRGYAMLHAYEDPLPTNCCAAWFCPGSHATAAKKRLVNIAVFFYGCNFDCLFCQNESHKEFWRAPLVKLEDFVSSIKNNERAYCVCYFGGSPEPQLPFAVKASEMLVRDGGSGRKLRICWEWNGCGNHSLVRKAASLSLESGGIVKFDLKAFDENLNLALSGVSNSRAFENFEMIAKDFFEGSKPPVLTATTLLVPYYVDEKEVGKIAEFIASLNLDIPYSLLIFHPDFHMSDLPITPRSQVERCYKAAKKHLNNVNIGNKHLLAWAPP